MSRHLLLGVSLAMLGSLAVAPLAAADQPAAPSHAPRPGQFQEVATSTSYTQGQAYTDSAGNRYYQDSIYTGTLTGTPITGSFRFDGNFFYPAGATSGHFDGAFVDTDGQGNAIFGHMVGKVTFDTSGNATDSGRYDISGGIGTYVHARGHGQFSGTVTNNGQNVVNTFSGESRPGKGLGDQHHSHTAGGQAHTENNTDER